MPIQLTTLVPFLYKRSWRQCGTRFLPFHLVHLPPAGLAEIFFWLPYLTQAVVVVFCLNSSIMLSSLHRLPLYHNMWGVSSVSASPPHESFSKRRYGFYYHRLHADCFGSTFFISSHHKLTHADGKHSIWFVVVALESRILCQTVIRIYFHLSIEEMAWK